MKHLNFLSRLASWMDGLSSRIRPVSVSYPGSQSFVPLTERQPRDEREMTERQNATAKVYQGYSKGIRFAATILVLLWIGVGNVWGVAFAPSNFSGQGTSGTGSAISATVDGVTFACDKGFGTTQIRCYSGGKITISSSSTITAISFTFSGSNTGGLETSYTDLSTTSWTKTLSSQARITACTVTVAATYSVVWTINPAGYGTLSKTTGTTTTVTPGSAYTYGSPAYTVTSGGATVSQSTNTFTATPTANCTIRINMVEKPKYTVTLKDDNSELTQATAGASVTLPSREGCTGYTFEGWTKSWNSTQTEWTTTAPTIIPAGSYTPTDNENLYPVYTKTEGGGTTYQFQKVTALSQINEGGTFIISNGNYYLPNTGTSSAPTLGTMPTVTGNVITGTVTDGMKWSFSAANEDGHVTITSVAEPTKYLYTISNNNGLRVNTTSDTWTFEEYTVSSILGFAMKSTSQSRYCATYNSQDWRSYASKNHANYGVNSGRLDIYKYTSVSSSTTYYISEPNCCTSLATINGAVGLSNEGCAAGELKATWKTNSEGIAGIASQVLHVYKASDDSEVTAKKITDITASTENQTQTISGLDNCTEYYVRVENISAGSTYCGDGWAGDKSANATTKGYSYSFTLTDGHVTKTAGTARETTCDGDIDYTFAAISGWILPTSISVTNAGDENDNWTWDRSKGELIIFAEGVTGNVSVIITATAAPCTPLVMSGVTVSGKDYPYNAVTLSWTAVEHADGYTVEIYDGETKIEGDDLDSGADSYAIATTLAANKTYTYKVKATSETPATYCESNWATDNFTTNDYPAATLTLHDANGSSDFTGSHKLFDVVELPSTAAACSKTFMGWSADENRSTAPEFAKGANYTLNALSQDLYAVYADVTGGGTSTTNIAYTNTGTTVNMAEDTNEAAKFGLNDEDWSIIGAKGGASNNVGLNKAKEIRMYWHAEGGNTLTITAPQTISSIELTMTANKDNAWVKVGGNTIEPTDGIYTVNATSFVIGNANTTNVQVVITNIAVNFTTPGTPSNYSTTCAAAPIAEASPTNLNDIAAAGASGTITMTYEHVNTANVAVALYNDAACTEAFEGEWLSASLNGDKNIAYSIAANTSYNDARAAYIKLIAPAEASGPADAEVIIPVSQAKKPAVFTSLAELAAADVAANTNVTVTLTNEVIKEIYYYPNNTSENNRKGIVFNVQKNDADVKIYFASGVVPTTWVAGGKVSATLTDCPWKTYQSTWQLAPANTWAWDQLTYTAPPAIESIEIRGAASKKTYIDGQAFDHTGLTAIAIYDNSEEEDVTGYATWTYNPAKLSEGDTEVEVSAEYLGHSDSETISELTVNPIPNKTIAEFIAAGGTRCYLEGIVSNYTNTTKGYFDLTDASGTLYIYGCTSPSLFAAGDKVRVIAETYEYYQSTTHEAKNVVYVSKVSPVAITITDAGSLSVEKDQTLTISATTDPEGAVANITYNVKAGSEDYASIEDNVVTGKAKGIATIIASIPAGDGYLANSVEFEVDVVEYFSITYEENGGSTVADVTKALALPNPLPETTKENYTFNGWFTTSTFDAETEAVAGATLTGNVTLYAKWTEIPVWARTYGSNVTLVGGGTSHEDANVVINAESYPAEKAGASKNTGTISITVPAGTNAVHFHGFAWNNASVTVSVAASPAVTNISASSFDLAGDAAGTGSSPYSIGSNPVNHYNSFTFDAVEEATTFTFSKTGGSDNRFILYGVNAIYPEITLSPVSYDFENVRANATKEQVFTISANENVSGVLSASIIEDASSKYSVSAIEDNKVTVTFDPNGAEEGTFTAKLKITASNASVTADLSGTAIAALAPEITVDKNAVAFGQVEPNASVSEDIQIGLLNIEGAVSAALSGDDAAKFALSATSFTEDDVLTITPNTTENGIFEATLTLSATGADDVVLPITMTVASKWAAMYTSNLTPVGTSMESKKVNINSTNYNAYKKAKAENATITLPKGTQKLHLHVVAWNGEGGDITISGSCFNSDKIINVPENEDVSGPTGTYVFTEKLALSYYHELVLDNVNNNSTTTITISKSGSRIVLFGVNQEGGTYEIEDDANISTLPENANMEVKNGVTLTVDAASTLDNLTVEAGGKVSGESALTVNNLTIQTTSGSTENQGKSGQLTGSVMPVVSGDLFIEIKLCEGAMDAEASRKWYCISAPFNVNMNGGFFWGDGTQMVLNTDFQLFEWDGDRRATGISGWKRVSGVMKAGIAYFIGFDDERSNQNIIKLKATNKTISNKSSINAPEHSSSVDDKYANWNGLANPNFRHIALNKDVQAFDHNIQAYTTYATDDYNFVVGTPFFIKETGNITIEAADNSSFRAPKREVEQLSYCVRIVREGKAGFDNQMYVRASEEASASYEEGHDLVTMNAETSNYGALLWTVNYGGKRLAIEEAPLVNDKASYALSFYAPADGAYRIETPTVREDASLYLTYEGNIIWDLSAGAYELELNKGATEGYGLMLVRKAPQVTTGMETVDNSQSTIHNCQKVILNDHVYILRDAQLYDVTGKAVK